jgi:CxxC motif-containing protein (DUF1111 family)
MITRAWPFRLLPLFAVTVAVLAGMGAPRVAQTDTPADSVGFDNKSNGFDEAVGFDFDKDRAEFDKTEKVEDGLGPVYNSTGCVGCHQNAGFVIKQRIKLTSGAVSGTSSQASEIRAGHDQKSGDGEIFFQDAPGGSLIQQRAIDPQVQERVPDDENVRTLRMATSVLGDGFVESIPDLDIIRVRDGQEAAVRGVANLVPVAVKPIIEDNKVKDFVFETRIGRFGWKCQEASLLNFAANAYHDEMGITNPLQPFESTSLGGSVADFDLVDDPEDPAILQPDSNNPKPHPFGKDVESFTRFMRSTKAPPQAVSVEPDNVRRGRQLFERIGCVSCHHTDFITAPEGTRFGDFTVPAKLAGKIIKPYSDFLLHDIGTGDGIVQTQFSDLPPLGLTESVTDGNIRLNIDRLNALLRGEPDPKYSGQSKALRGLGNTAPAIQVRTITQFESKRVNPPRQLFRQASAAHPTTWMYTSDTAPMIRTAPLWGLRTRPQLLHNGLALTILDAIKQHRKQAEAARSNFDHLKGEEKQLVLDFLNFL